MYGDAAFGQRSAASMMDVSGGSILVTGCSRSHFSSLVAWLYSMVSITAQEPARQLNTSIVIYDLGLSPTQRAAVELHFQHSASFRTFDFDAYPSFMRVEGGERYAGEWAWKAVVVEQLMADGASAVIWMDTGMRFGNPLTSGNTSAWARRMVAYFELLHSERFDGFGSTRSGGTIGKSTHNATVAFVSALTNKSMHRVSGGVPCNGGIVGFARKPKSLYMLSIWKNCSMQLECISPGSASRASGHRQDQSVVSVLAYQLGLLASCRLYPSRYGLYSHIEDKDCWCNASSHPLCLDHARLCTKSQGGEARSAAAALPLHKGLSILTAATHVGVRERRLLRMCASWGFNCTLLGQGEKWRGYQWLKDTLFIPALRSLQPDELVITMDAADMVIQATREEVLRRYKSVLRQHLNTSNPVGIVGTLESSCPGPWLTHGRPCPTATDSLEAGIRGLTHLNGGFMMGPAGRVLDVWQSVGRQDPQYAIGVYGTQHRDAFAPDTRQLLTATIVLQEREWQDHFVVENATHLIMNRHTELAPAFIHFPGTQERLRSTRFNTIRMKPFDQAMQAVEAQLAQLEGADSSSRPEPPPPHSMSGAPSLLQRPELAFLHIPKTSGTAIEHALGIHVFQKMRLECSYWHVPPRWLPKPPGDNATRSESFCVVRHPYERMVSEFRDLMKYRRGPFPPGRVRLPASPSCSGEDLDRYVAAALDAYQVSGRWWTNDCHLVPQATYMATDNGSHPGCTVVLNQNDLNFEFAALMRQQGTPNISLTATNRNLGACPGLGVGNLSQASKARLDTVYAEDMSRFGFRPASQSQRVLFVTAFQDINRGNRSLYGWQSRNVEWYVAQFKLLAHNLAHLLIVYLEPSVLHTFVGEVSNSNVHFVPLSNVSDALFSRKYASIERDIMSSERYREMTKRHRMIEHQNPLYNLVNHDKVVFARDAATRFGRGYSHVSWIDFGAIRSNLRHLPGDIDECKLPSNRVLYQIPARSSPAPSGYARAPEEMAGIKATYVYGSMWVAPVGLIRTYEAVYERELRRFHHLGVSDDDQNVVYQLLIANPHLFACFAHHEWFSLFSSFLNKQSRRPCEGTHYMQFNHTQCFLPE